MDKICFVVQRYGLEVNGGAELHCRQLAEHMCSFYDVTVLTTKAVDYITWENEYSQDEEEVNGVHVKRFPVEYPRVMDIFNKINGQYAKGEIQSREQELEWLEKQGPVVPTLLRYLQEYKDKYKVFIFFTYLYYPTVLGIPIVKEKAILIPTAHREPFLEMSIYQNVFRLPRVIFYNTREEKYLSEFVFENERVKNDIGGVGIELPDKIEPAIFKEKYHLNDYILYVGRIDEGKGCQQLFRYFEYYKKQYKNDLKLVLMGKEVIDVPPNDDIISLGFVSDEDKFNGMAGSLSLVLPSEFESLSMVVLETLNVGRPVIVNGNCEVLAGHCIRSNAGFYYQSYIEFAKCIEYLLNHKAVAEKMGILGKRYVEENYTWDAIIYRLRRLVQGIIEGA